MFDRVKISFFSFLLIFYLAGVGVGPLHNVSMGEHHHHVDSSRHSSLCLLICSAAAEHILTATLVLVALVIRFRLRYILISLTAWLTFTDAYGRAPPFPSFV